MTTSTSLARSLLASFLLAPAAAGQTWLFELSGGDVPGLAGSQASVGQGVDGGRDLDGDGVPDVVAGAPGQPAGGLVAWSGASGALLLHLPGQPFEHLGRGVAMVGDCDGDGTDDVVAGGEHAAVFFHARLVSGATGTSLGTVTSGVVGDEFGRALAPLGDLDGDGRGDFAVGARADSNFTGKVYVCSGAQVAAGVGAPFLHVLAGPAASSFGYAVAGLGDVDGDGFDDLAVGAPSVNTEDGQVGAVFVHSGASGNVLFSTSAGAHGQQFGLSVGAADVDGDGVRDLLVGAPGGPGSVNSPTPFVRVYSGAVIGGGGGPALLHDLSVPAYGDLCGFGRTVAGAGDVDGDGLEDFTAAIPFVPGLPPGSGTFRLHSGSGALLAEVQETAPSKLAHGNGRRPLAALGDVTGDGLDDFVVGAPSTPLEGAVRVYAGVDLGLPSAAVTDIGAGCGPSAPAPDLAVTAGVPELGESVTLGIDHVTPHASGLLLIGSPTAAPVPLGAGCFLHLDPALLVPAAVGSLGANAALVTAPIPFDWHLAGVVVRFQAAFAAAASPIGAEVSDAVELLVGY